jgi:outer membrane protein OmpA-like peptidoglycan-associated protein
MKKLIIPIILFIGIGVNVSAQDKLSKESKGDRYAFSYSFDKAINSYNKSKTLSLDGQRSLAESYHNIGQNLESEGIYSNLIKSQGQIVSGNFQNNQVKQSGAAFSGTSTLPGKLLPEDYYNYAMVLKSNGKYDEANKMMYIFVELVPEDLRARDFENHSGDLTYLLKDNGRYKIDHLNINTDALDFGTSYYNDKVVFASSRVPNNIKAKLFRWTRKPFWDMYVSEKDGDQLKNPEIFDKSLNGKMHDGPASFSNNGMFMAFTRNNYHDKSRDRIVELQIYFSSFKEDKWSMPEPFFLNNNDYSVGHPSLTSDGNTMYFTSDMPGGYGKADIYRVTKDEKGEWGKPENLGDKINTEGDEMFPFIDENKKMLFFASDGHFGLGGLDIFICPVTGSGFGTVYNPGIPFNTQYNDYAAIANDSMSKGYFTSDRSGGSGGDDIYSVEFLSPDVKFTVNAPENIPVMRRVRETFPLRNYVFFNQGSTDIPDRYVLLNKDQVNKFREDQLEEFLPMEVSGRSKRQMTVYYNVLNILGSRMAKDTSTIVRLSGASMDGTDIGTAMAESVKRYLVDVFGIDPSRLNTEGRIKPRIPSEQPGGKRELDLLREGDNRVSIWSESPGILMEFQSGPDAPLKPVEIISMQEAPPDSYVNFYVDGATEALSSWSLEVIDSAGSAQKFGPYSLESASIPGKSILGSTPKGDFRVKMTGQTKNGNRITKDANVHIVLWTPPENQEMMRFSTIFEFNDSHAIPTYTKYLTDIVAPKVPDDGIVIIHGHTDIIGDEDHNQKLSMARASEVKNIMEKAVSASGVTGVKFEVKGFGEDQILSPFENRYPEERFYNRTVIIDIIPANK